MADKIEIERRWILSNVPSEKYDECLIINQKYDSNGIRYRNAMSWEDAKCHFSKTKKSPAGFGSNHEEEYEIDSQEYENALAEKSIGKIRRIYNHNGLRFELDSFDGIQLIILECELDSIDQKIDIPDFLKRLIIYEVTGIKEFSNWSLAKPE